MSICGTERQTLEGWIFWVSCRAVRPTIQKLRWEESDSRISDRCGHSKDRAAHGTVHSICGKTVKSNLFRNCVIQRFLTFSVASYTCESVMANLSGVYDSDDWWRQSTPGECQWELDMIGHHTNIILFLTSIPTSLCSLCNRRQPRERRFLWHTAYLSCFETKPTAFKRKCILVPPTSMSMKQRVSTFIQSSYSVTVFVHACLYFW